MHFDWQRRGLFSICSEVGSVHFEQIIDYAKHEVSVAIRCNACRHTRSITAAQAAAIFGYATRVQAAAARCRCSKCGGKGARFTAVPQLDP